MGRWTLALLMAVVVAPLWCAPKVLLLVRTNPSEVTMEAMLRTEAIDMSSRLSAAGYEVVVATQDGRDLLAGSQRLRADVAFAAVHVTDFAAVVIPCMQVGGLAEGATPEALAIVQQAADRGLFIAAQHSLELLEPLGLVRAGHAIAISPGVAVDGNLITSANCPHQSEMNGKPVDTAQLIAKLVALLPART